MMFLYKSKIKEMDEQTSLMPTGEDMTEQSKKYVYQDSPKQKGLLSSRRVQLAIVILTLMAAVLIGMYFSDDGLWLSLTLSQQGLVDFPFGGPNNQLFKALQKRITNKVWLYSTFPGSKDPLLKYQQSNYDNFVTNRGFHLTTISQENYHQYVPAQTHSMLEATFKSTLQKIKTKEYERTRFKENIPNLIQHTTMLHVLLHNGGIALHSNLTLTQSLNWVYAADSNPYVNRNSNDQLTQVVGFFHPRLSSLKVTYKTQQKLLNPFKHIRNATAIHPALIAAQKQARFIKDLCSETLKLLQNPNQWFDEYRKLTITGWLNIPGLEIIMAVSRKLMEDKQAQLSQETKDNPTLAVDYYGLSLINALYGPEKMQKQFEFGRDVHMIRLLRTLTIDQFQTNFGYFRYGFYFIKNEGIIQQEMTRILKGEVRVLNGSFIQKLYPSIAGKAFNNPEKGLVNAAAPKWESLPKKIWVIWDSGLQKAPLVNRIAFEVIKRKHKNTSFEVNLVTKENVNQYLDEQTISKINQAIKNGQRNVFRTTLANFYRLALLIKHGGVYMDMATYLKEDMNWLVQITRFPSQFIYNRYGSTPKLFFTFVFLIGNPNQWHYDAKYNTKSAWHLWYENSFIAAEKDNQFLKEWFQMYSRFITMPLKDIQVEFQKCGIASYAKVSQHSMYLLQMDCLKCVLGAKQKEIQNNIESVWSNAAHYYGLWSISALIDAFKYRSYNGFQYLKSELNPFFYEYSEDYVTGILGKSKHYVKMCSLENGQLDHFLAKHSQSVQELKSVIHPSSFLGKLIKDNNIELTKKDKRIQVVPMGLQQ